MRAQQTEAATLTGRKLGYVAGIDGFRGIAALLVVGFHARIPGFDNGDIGVSIFLALSGFMITSVLLGQSTARRRIDWRHFYRRRALRLFPAYLSVVAVCALVDLLSNSGGTLAGAFASLVFAANWVVAVRHTGLGTLDHMWSLSLQEQFYLVWPVLLALMLRKCAWQTRRVQRAVAALLLAFWLLTLALTLCDAPFRFVASATPTRAVELLIGCLFAVGLQGDRSLSASSPRRARFVSVSGTVALLGLLELTLHVPLAGDPDILVTSPVIALLTCVVILAILQSAWLGRALAARPLVAIGKRSYGVYVWHFPILVVIDEHLGLHAWAPRLLGLAITALVVAASYRYIERPFLISKQRNQVAPLQPAPDGTQATTRRRGGISNVRRIQKPRELDRAWHAPGD